MASIMMPGPEVASMAKGTINALAAVIREQKELLDKLRRPQPKPRGFLGWLLHDPFGLDVDQVNEQIREQVRLNALYDRYRRVIRIRNLAITADKDTVSLTEDDVHDLTSMVGERDPLERSKA